MPCAWPKKLIVTSIVPSWELAGQRACTPVPASCVSVQVGTALGSPAKPDGRSTTTSLTKPSVLPLASVLRVNWVVRSAWAPAWVVEGVEKKLPGARPNEPGGVEIGGGSGAEGVA